MRKFPWKNWAEWETVYNGFFDYLDPEMPELFQSFLFLVSFFSMLELKKWRGCSAECA